MSSDESTVWQGRPSQVVNFKYYLACLLIIPIPFAFWKWLQTRCFSYELTTQRLRIAQGVFSRTTDELELYRIKDLSLVQPFFLRLFSLGNVVLLTSDRSTPKLTIEAVADAGDLHEKLRRLVEELRDRKRVREVDFE